MFLFIGKGFKEAGTGKVFKYISCSYLSQANQMQNQTQNIFKYISCSYLSISIPILETLGLVFKYISCSYLSKKRYSELQRKKYLNTSHVLIYQKPSVLQTNFYGDLNTSHVLIYRKRVLC